jgi:RNA polymerase sigma-70 factor (ECF subfamily)
MNQPRSLPTAEPAAPGVPDWSVTLALHQGWLRRVVASRLDEAQAVEEVMQDVALAAVAQRSPLHNPARAAVWLYRLAVRHVLLYRRKMGRQRSLVSRYAARSMASEVDASISPLGWLVRDERQQLVQQALRRLPPRDAEILILKHAEGYAARDLAERLGVAVATVESRLHRARRRLRAELADLAAEFEAPDYDGNGRSPAARQRVD